jgi:hypothetical protein
MRPLDNHSRCARSPRRHGRKTSATLAVLSAACLTVGLSGCGNWITVNNAGHMGLTVDATGRPVVAVMTCSKATPMVSMDEGRKKSDAETAENVSRGSWQARHAYAGVEKLALTAPGALWKTTSNSGPLEHGTLFVVDGGTLEDDNASLGGVMFHVEDLGTLSPDVVEVDGKITSWRSFAAYKCD